VDELVSFRDSFLFCVFTDEVACRELSVAIDPDHGPVVFLCDLHRQRGFARAGGADHVDRPSDIKPPFYPRLDLLDCLRLDERLFLRSEAQITVSRRFSTTTVVLLLESFNFLVFLMLLPLLLLFLV
jgi:hypothetical protein